MQPSETVVYEFWIENITFWLHNIVRTPHLLCIYPQLPKLHSPCKESILLPNVFLHSTVLSEQNCWTNFNFYFYFNSRRLLYLGVCLLEWRRAVDMHIYKYPKTALVTRGSFCYRNCSAESKKLLCLQLQRQILHLTWTSAADQSLPDPYNLGRITAYLTNLVREMFQTYNNTSHRIKRRQRKTCLSCWATNYQTCQQKQTMVARLHCTIVMYK